MDIRQLRYFVEIVEQGSLSRAAQRLAVAQPALSAHLRNMEDELGTRLLNRGRGGVTETEAGGILLRYARRILADRDRAVDEIRSLGDTPSGEVRIGLPGTISHILTLPLIEAASRLYPRIKVTVSEAMSGFVADWLREGRVDLAVLYMAPQEAGLAAQALLEEDLVAVGAPGMFRTQEGAQLLTLRDLARLPLILPSRPHGLRGMLDGVFAGAGLTLQPKLEIDSYNTIKALCARSAGVSILPQHTVAEECRAGSLALRPVAAPGLSRRVHLVWRESRAVPRVVGLLRDLLQDRVHALVTTGGWTGARLDAALSGAASREDASA